MIKELLFNDIDKEIESFSDNYNNMKVVVTGLDGTGKTTLVSKYFTKCNVYRVGERFKDLYLGSKSVKEAVDELGNLFDRHPLIDSIVYHNAYCETDRDIIRKNIAISIKNFDYSKFNKIIILLKDKFLGDGRNDGWIIEKRDVIHDSFIIFAEELSKVYPDLPIYLVKD